MTFVTPILAQRSLPFSDLDLAHYGLVTAAPAPTRFPVLGWLSVALGVALLATALLSSALFVRSMLERTEYAGSSLCSDEPVGDCYVEVEATVVGKRVDARAVFVDDHVLELNEVDGPAVTLADGHGLWSAVQPGEPVTLRLWRGDAVHVSADGHEAETVDSPRVGTQRHYAAGLGTLGLGGLLIVAGLGLLSVRRHQSADLARGRSVGSWVARVALAATCVGVAGFAAELYTRAAPILLVTLLGVGVLLAIAGLVRLTRSQLVRGGVAL